MNKSIDNWFSNDSLFFGELTEGDSWTRYVAKKLNEDRNQMSRT